VPVTVVGTKINLGWKGLRSIVLVRGHMFIIVYHEMYFISWIFRAFPSFLVLFPDYKFLCNFLS